MTIQFYKNVSESNALDKTIAPLILITGTLRDESSIIDPVMHVTDLENYIADINYAYIAEFHRFYFVNNIELSDFVNNTIIQYKFEDLYDMYNNDFHTNDICDNKYLYIKLFTYNATYLAIIVPNIKHIKATIKECVILIKLS